MLKILKRTIDFVMDGLETFVFIGSVYIVVYIFLFFPSEVRGASMEPTLHNKDRFVISKIAYRLGDPHRGDIVVVRSPENPDIDFIKRVVALPGDKLLLKDGDVFINGKKIDETYVSSPTYASTGEFLKEGQELVVPDNNYFVMGDNRERSADSRTFGFFARGNVIGKAIFRYFPPSDVGLVVNPFSNR